MDDILFDGTKAALEKIKCPDCGSSIGFEFDPRFKSLAVRCEGCGYLARHHNVAKWPNCALNVGKSFKSHSG